MLLDHLALRCVLIGRLEDGAALAGFTDRAYRDRGWPRQHVEQAAAEQLQALLAGSVPANAMIRLMKDGASLTEAGAWAIAMRETAAEDAEAMPSSL